MTENPKKPGAGSKPNKIIGDGDNIRNDSGASMTVYANNLKHGFGQVSTSGMEDRVVIDCNSKSVPTYALNGVDVILLDHFDKKNGDRIVSFAVGNMYPDTQTINTIRRSKFFEGGTWQFDPTTINTTGSEMYQYLMVVDRDGQPKAALRVPLDQQTQILTSPDRASGEIFHSLKQQNIPIEALYPTNSEAAREAAKAIDKKIATGSAKSAVADLIGQVQLHTPSSADQFALSGQLPTVRDMSIGPNKANEPKMS